MADRRQDYEARLAARRRTETSLIRRDERLGTARLLTIFATVILAGAAWNGWLSSAWLMVPIVAFIGLMGLHDRVIRARERATRAVQWFERGLQRLDDAWAGAGDAGERFHDEEHPYAQDLDLFGRGSLFERLSLARTSTGEETLAAWLLGPAAPDVIAARQGAVAELAERADLREDLFTLGADARDTVDSARLVAWATGASTRAWPRIAREAGGLTITWLAATAGWLVDLVPGPVVIIAGLVNAVYALSLAKVTMRVLHGSSEPARELIIVARLLHRLQDEDVEDPHLRRLRDRLAGRDDPVRATRHLDQLIQRHDWQHNLFFLPIAIVTIWSGHCAAAVEAWRSRHGPTVAGWLAVVGELEALSAFATYHHECPDDPFPEVSAPTRPPVFEADALAHPLLPRAEAVANDVRLGAAPQLLVVSGSNMSGKTTLLRAVGVAAVMALAGAPVRATRLRLSPVALGGTLRVEDSLLAGRSKFYAEILRVSQLVRIARGDRPLLFLMDELFHGTNSHDRVEGAHGVLTYLVDLGAIGLVTTHDLALATLGDRLQERGVNLHFADDLVDGELAFDYRLRPGHATRGNALALMRAVGLRVGGDAEPGD